MTVPALPWNPESDTPSNCTVPALFEKNGSVTQKFNIDPPFEIESMEKSAEGNSMTPDTAFIGASFEETTTLSEIRSPTEYTPPEGLTDSVAAKPVLGILSP